jgi:hypothetical protein
MCFVGNKIDLGIMTAVIKVSDECNFVEYTGVTIVVQNTLVIIDRRVLDHVCVILKQ